MAFSAAGLTAPFATAQDWHTLRGLATEELLRLANVNDAGSAVAQRAQLTLADRLATRDSANARRWVDGVLQHAETESDEHALAIALNCQLLLRGGEPGTKELCAEVRDGTLRVDSLLVETQILLISSFLAYREGDHGTSRSAVETAVANAKRTQDPRLNALSNNWLGVHHATVRRPRLALPHYQEAWTYSLKAVDSADIQRTVRLNVANVYSQIGKHKEALDVFEAMDQHPEYSQPARRLISAVMRAEALIGSGRPDEAEVALASVLEITGGSVQQDTYAYALSTLAHAQLEANRLPEALTNFIESMRMMGVSPPNGLDVPRAQPVLVPFARALAMSGRKYEAEAVLDGVIENVPADEPNQILLDAWLERSRLARVDGRQNDALQAERRARDIRAWLTNTAYEYRIGRLHAAIELEVRTAELALVKERAKNDLWNAQREKRRRTAMLLTFVLSLLIGYLWLGRRMQKRLATSERTQKVALEQQVAERTEELENEMAGRLAGELAQSKLTQQLAESEKMRALGQLTAGVAHDFNNLMTIVTLTSDYLQEVHFTPGSEPHRLLNDILTAANSGARITNGLLAYARRQTLVPEQIDLKAFFDDNATLFRNSLGERAQLVVNVEPCSITIDSGQLTTAILNLLLNAREAIQERGTVTITSMICEEFAEVCVRDTGTGMSPDTLERAVEPFFSTKSGSEGVGLGLSMVYGFAEQSGGSLRLTSQPGTGTTARLRLPIAACPLAIVTPAPRLAHEASLDRRVLVAEDRDALRAMLGQLLEALGWDVTAVPCADTAMAEIDSNGPPDLLISDVLMPGSMDGYELAGRLRCLHPDLPVLIMSGYADAGDSDYAFLSKPFTQRDLREAIDAAIERSAESQASAQTATQ
ncbi:MAG: ATP-binding protein [Pseudomonadota bacterium]